MKLNGSQIVLEVLKEQGVDTIFGYPGGTILNIFDELYKYWNNNKGFGSTKGLKASKSNNICKNFRFL